MHYKDFLPKRDRDFLGWVLNFLKVLATLITKLVFPSEIFDEVEKKCDNFAAALEIAEEPSTRTSSAVLEKNLARKELETQLRQVVKEFLTYSSQLTDVDRNNLGLPIHSISRTPTPMPITYPDMDIDSSVIRRLTIHFRDQGKDSKAKPLGVHGVEIRNEFLTAAPTKVADLTHSVFDTRSPYTFEYEEDQRGKTVYFALRWENTRGEKGPWSEIVSAIVP